MFSSKNIIFILSLFLHLIGLRRGNQGFEKGPRRAWDTAVWLHSKCGWCPCWLASRQVPRAGLSLNGSDLRVSGWLALGDRGFGFDLCLPLHEKRYQQVPLRMDFDLGAHRFLGGILVAVARLPTEHRVLGQRDQLLWKNLWCLN